MISYSPAVVALNVYTPFVALYTTPLMVTTTGVELVTLNVNLPSTRTVELALMITVAFCMAVTLNSVAVFPTVALYLSFSR